MFTRLVHTLLRYLAGAAVLAALASVVVSWILTPLPKPKPVALDQPVQTYSVEAIASAATPTFDTFEAVMPPTPKPTPVHTKAKTHSAPARPRKPVYGSPQAYARSVLGSRQFSCLNNIAIRESGWNVHAQNPYSPAYGIPQALPGYKMASAGSDWHDNPVTQVKWMIGYVNSRYGSACGAWGYWQAHSNY